MSRTYLMKYRSQDLTKENNIFPRQIYEHQGLAKKILVTRNCTSCLFSIIRRIVVVNMMIKNFEPLKK